MSEIAFDPTASAQATTTPSKPLAFDLAPVTLHTIDWRNCSLRFKTDLTLTPTLSEETPQLLIADKPELCLHVFAETRADLIQEIHEQIAFMWQEYVKTDATDLAADALKLRETLLTWLE